MEAGNNRGSEWRRWDLHIHSDASDGKMTLEEIIEEAKEKELSVIALTDHHTFKNTDALVKLGEEQGIFVIRGVEFRTELGKRSVHMIGLFPHQFNGVELNQKYLTENVLNCLGLSETLIQQAGREKVEKYDLSDDEAFKEGMHLKYVEFVQAANLIHKYGGIVTVHAGNKGNGIEQELRNCNQNGTTIEEAQEVVKEDLVRKGCIDVFEISENDETYKSLYIKKCYKSVIIASDAHEKKEIGNKFVWIKADTTFEGLKQILYEPEDRVLIPPNRPEEKPEYQIIDSIKLCHEDFGEREQVIPFNSNLNVIIGGRSSGKSLLLGCIANLAGGIEHAKTDNDEYNKYVRAISENSEIKWKDDDDRTNRKIEFFSQYRINDLIHSKIKKQAFNNINFQNWVRDILLEQREFQNAYEEYKKEKENIRNDIFSEINQYFGIYNKINDLGREIQNIGGKEGIENEIKKIDAYLQKLIDKQKDNFSVEEQEQFASLHNEKIELEKNNKQIDNNIWELEKLKKITLFNDNNLYCSDDQLLLEIKQEYEDIKERFKKIWVDNLDKKICVQTNKKTEQEQRIDDIEKNEVFIRGNKYLNEHNEIDYYSERLDIEKEKLSNLNSLQIKIETLKKELEQKHKNLFIKQSENYDVCLKFIYAINIDKDDICIVSNVDIDWGKYVEFIENNYDNRSEEYRSETSKLLDYIKDYEKSDKQNSENKVKFIEQLKKIFDATLHGTLKLKGKKNVKEILQSLVHQDYFEVSFDVKYQNDSLSQMSEGKGAFVILKLLLGFSSNRCPILLDQPEDGLDNRAIFADLVKYIRSKKKERQIFIVTHNANIVVGADAEEIIVANQHGAKNENKDDVKFQYISGALENTFVDEDSRFVLESKGIREHVCEILEGGTDAFELREKKYNIIHK